MSGVQFSPLPIWPRVPTFAGLPITFMGASASGGPIPPSASQVMQMQQLTLRQWMLLILVIALIIAPSFESVRLGAVRTVTGPWPKGTPSCESCPTRASATLITPYDGPHSRPGLGGSSARMARKVVALRAPASEVRHRRDLSLAFG